MVPGTLDSVAASLNLDPHRTWVQVEQVRTDILSLCEVMSLQSFFQRWWKLQPPKIKQMVSEMVANQQFEFSNGGW